MQDDSSRPPAAGGGSEMDGEDTVVDGSSQTGSETTMEGNAENPDDAHDYDDVGTGEGGSGESSESESTTVGANEKKGNDLPHSIQLDSDSSLRYKYNAKNPTERSAVENDIAAGVEKPLTTKPNRKKTHAEMMEEAQQQQQQNQQQQQQQQGSNLHRTTDTRARGSGGPPPHRYDLSDLSQMTSEQIMKAFRDDPELHAEAVKASEQNEKASRRSNRNSSRNRKRSSSSSSSSFTSSKRRQEMSAEDVNFPMLVIQWALVLLLMGFLGTQVRKIAMASTRPSGSGKRNSVGPKGISGGKHQKKQQKSSKKQNKASRRTSDQDDNGNSGGKKAEEPKLVEDEQVITDLDSSKPTKVLPPSAKNKKSNKKKKQRSNKVDNAETSEGTNGKAKDVEQSNSKLAETSPKNADTSAPGVDDTATSTDFPDGDDDGELWQTVVKSKNSTGKKQEDKVEVKEPSKNVTAAVPATDAASEKKPSQPVTNDETVLDEIVPAAQSAPEADTKDAGTSDNASSLPSDSNGKEKEATTNPPKNGKSKSSKKKKKGKPATTTGGPAENQQSSPKEITPSTDKDAELARKLQLEEENLARSETENNKQNNAGAADEEVWEEVTQKKKRGTLINSS